MKQWRIVLPLEVWGNFDEDYTREEVKELLGEQLDNLLISTDYLYDYWKDAQVEYMGSEPEEWNKPIFGESND